MTKTKLVLIYVALGPVLGALLYVGMSLIAVGQGYRTNLFMDPSVLGQSLGDAMSAAGWQVMLSAPLSLLPAVLTGWLTAQRWPCAWWESCLYGGVVSGAAALPFLFFARRAYPDLVIIPPAFDGSALIALIGFLGTLPCWLVARTFQRG